MRRLKYCPKPFSLVFFSPIFLVFVLLISSTVVWQRQSEARLAAAWTTVAAQRQAALPQWPHCVGRRDDAQPPLVTVVTSMIVLSKGRSKHSTKSYENWIANTLRSVSAPLVLFLAGFPGGEDRIRELRGNLPLRIINVADTWELPRASELRAEYEGPQRVLDIEKNIHSAELYAIWNGKSELDRGRGRGLRRVPRSFFSCFFLQLSLVDMLVNVSATNPFCSHFFLWADAGGFRERVFPGWPSPGRVVEAFAHRPADGMLFSLVSQGVRGWVGFLALAGGRPYVELARDLRWHTVPFLLQGGFLGGSARAIESFAVDYRAHLLHQNATGMFFGKDQPNYSILLASTLPKNSPQHGRHAAIRAAGTCGNDWYVK